MKIITLTTACMLLFTPLVHAKVFSPSFALKGIPEVEKSAYDAQLADITKQARTKLVGTGTYEVFEDELEVAPLVIVIDFQDRQKVDQNVSVVGEYRAWMSDSDYQELATEADIRFTKKLRESLNEVYSLSEAPQRVAENPKKPYNVSFPVSPSGLNSKMPSEKHTAVADGQGGFSSEKALKATELASEDGDSVIFFPYVNMVFHKQNAGVSQMSGEVLINYVVEMNGYFLLCVPQNCLSAKLADKNYINFIAPLVHFRSITSDETQKEVFWYGQELLAQMVSNFVVEGFDVLADFGDEIEDE
ncbi:hypothetical protein [Zhongshania sp. BJYM1]|uniref:hypothetical protein n=1 Tax=Zhongshania aquatica TaxID=2965069 RepID=UPI0022B380B6|nr:hypothetical protein [Marortus sp. BJYM1]